MKEQWKQIKEFSIYEVSNQGRVRRSSTVGNWKSGRIVKIHISHKGYPKVALYNGIKQIDKFVHRLVAEAFLPNSNPSELTEVNHKTGDKKDCRAISLEWTSPQGNKLHAVLSGLTCGDGVCFHKNYNKWIARFNPKKNKRVTIGLFNSKREALEARRKALTSISEGL